MLKDVLDKLDEFKDEFKDELLSWRMFGKLDELKDEFGTLDELKDELGKLDELKDELDELFSWRVSWVCWMS